MTIVGDRWGRRNPLQNSCMSYWDGMWRNERTLRPPFNSLWLPKLWFLPKLSWDGDELIMKWVWGGRKSFTELIRWGVWHGDVFGDGVEDLKVYRGPLNQFKNGSS